MAAFPELVHLAGSLTLSWEPGVERTAICCEVAVPARLSGFKSAIFLLNFTFVKRLNGWFKIVSVYVILLVF